MNAIHVELHVPDFKPVKAFYGALGFAEAWESKGDGSGAYLVMRLGDTPIAFWPGNAAIDSQPYFKRFDPATVRGYGVEVVIAVDDLDATYAIARGLGAVVEQLKTKPWGLRDFRCVDPFGYYLRLTEHHDPLDPNYAVNK